MADARKLPSTTLQNDSGACWTCLKQKRICDLSLPRCRNCAERGIRCQGYGIRPRWPADFIRRKKRPRRTSDGSSDTRGFPSMNYDTRQTLPRNQFCVPQALSSLGLPSQDSYFMQHFMKNLARVALAIDYNENGYRSLLPLALHDPGLMNAALAVASSHHSRWQQISDKDSRRYLRAAAAALKARFGNSSDLNSPVTLTIMLLLVSFEVFSGTPRWRGHFDAIRGWIRSRGDHSDLDPFLKTWVCLIETQCALNVGLSVMQEVESWIDLCPNSSDVAQNDSIDALFGCSSRLPKLMCAASQLQKASYDAEIPLEEIHRRSENLQKAIEATKMEDNSNPVISILCDGAREKYSGMVGLEQEELRRRMIATAEIFRHTSHLYVYRITHGVEEPLTSDMEESLQTALQLLTQVPDALGPGANLGWCLVVLGAELDLLDQRDYIRSRWYSMHLLGIYNTKSGEKILEAVWNHRDLVRSGLATPARWQDIMKDMGEHQILV